MVDPRLIESWSRLLASMRASAETIEMLLPFTGQNREQLASLLNRARSPQTRYPTRSRCV